MSVVKLPIIVDLSVHQVKPECMEDYLQQAGEQLVQVAEDSEIPVKLLGSWITIIGTQLDQASKEASFICATFLKPGSPFQTLSCNFGENARQDLEWKPWLQGHFHTHTHTLLHAYKHTYLLHSITISSHLAVHRIRQNWRNSSQTEKQKGQSLPPIAQNSINSTSLLHCSNGMSLRGRATRWSLLEVTRSSCHLLSGILQAQMIRESLKACTRWGTTGSGCVTKYGLLINLWSGGKLLHEKNLFPIAWNSDWVGSSLVSYQN